ncbi:hypothetical protein DFO73_101403 [Cytobacillus oceanisediminis]|uniref:Uncharacterized protein n=1 Tax=Cytobacillus oceanisediminis TaxID=665099 RepID=A0A2V3A7T2_9BACI|nr:hypothetical protein [Cytobacillus oceanisediminis]PWW32140.1 hypothetical protein DFO73_101403 [Cytobacillus oceanisediminis]
MQVNFHNLHFFLDFLHLVLLKVNVDFGTLLIDAEGASSSKLLSQFLCTEAIPGCLFNVLRESGSQRETPQTQGVEEALGQPVSAELFEEKSRQV